MRVDVLKMFRRRMARSVAVVAIAGLVAGCSSDVGRFDDSFYTGAVPRQPVPRVAMGQAQAYPGDLDQVNTGSVGRPAPAPVYGNNPGAGVQQQTYGGNGGYSPATRTASVERTMLPPPPAASAAPQPGYTAPAAPTPAYTPASAPVAQPAVLAATTAPQPSAATPSTKAGWQNTGNMVTLRDGETIDSLSNRYGVPAKAILAANGLSNGSAARPGQQISIPSYSYGTKSGQTRTAEAKPGQTLGTAPGPLRVPAPAVAGQAPATPARTSGASGVSVVVAPGDSLNAIARRSGVKVADLRAANGITDDNIRIGQTLVMPNGATPQARVAAKPAATTAAPQTVASIAPATKTTEPKPYEAPRSEAAKAEKPKQVAAIAPAAEPAPAAPQNSVADEMENDEASAAPKGTGIDQFRWPVQGRVVKRYGEKSGARRNDGVDISVPRGTPVKAAENGVVIYAGDGLKEFGNTVLVKHDNGLVTVYGHADDLKVKRGATVRRGQEIATAGVSGDTNTPMVHFEVRKNSAPVDPMGYLQ